ncbi:MAG TPA: type II toxin-antitoxin system RelB/DinJ family antitoxin [Patescibacteria group bacterium]|nr:type II toxin-antitoxin system RelB/DinJ family antitoxin [Patescibacteria group bacterium]
MNTAVINIKTDPKVKKQAQAVASELGLNLSSVINGYLRQFIKTKTVTFQAHEEPSEYMIQALKESGEDIKAGRVLSFKNGDDAVGYFESLLAVDEQKSI